MVGFDEVRMPFELDILLVLRLGEEVSTCNNQRGWEDDSNLRWPAYPRRSDVFAFVQGT